ncbi:MAG TPA: 30S ribosomal protein S4 [Saprospiraceae bacterium]|jgi:small subunit ribosomal protein S4|nr:MAG: 30S ribosomal protein S4 [Candidatus Parvibacillus calidus]MBX2937567.1 30S ribosomal protein S4 [Saprospiraceae bacterium]MBK7741892.1 30S ribosomal protein S4 [Candidatus Parvibacillus calidus]MBX7177942.1 30S ribosomal protein S4 [Saprospiraceae bacterium]MCC7149033.1 30S ribosomal protein S4 [Saprospiraceae bacterium]
MARYTGPATKKARAFGEAIYGPDKAFDKKKYAPGQHGASRKRRQKSDYALQLMEKQKAKYTYGVLERQFRNTFTKAARKGGVTGTVLLQFLESRLDNVVYRMGIASTRREARQLVSHRHVVVNGVVTNIPSFHVRPGDVVEVKGKSRGMDIILSNVKSKHDHRKYAWIEFNPERMEGKFLAYPEREQIPENINEQLIVELYSK